MRLGSTGRAGAGLVLASLISWSAASPTYGYKDICPLPCLGSPGLNSRGDDTKWTDLDFKAPAIADNEHMPAPERWSSLKCNDAWSDFVDHWKDQRDKYKDRDDGDKPEFSTSLVNFFDIKDSAHCGLPSGDNYCSEIASCADWSDTDKTGPAGLQIWNSFVFLHNMYADYFEALGRVSGNLAHGDDAFIDTFAPDPPDDDEKALGLFMDFVGLGTTVGISGLFKGVLKNLPYFIKAAEAGKTEKFDNFKELAGTLGSFGATVASQHVKASKDDWTKEAQNDFKKTMGESLSKMAETTAETMHQMFLGDDASIELLGNIMGDGQFIASGDHDTGYVSTPSYKAQQEGKDTMDAGIIKDFYAYAIPSVWSLSGKNVFVMWTELDCGDDADLTDVRLPKDAPTVCYDGKLWAIAYPDGRAEVCTHGKEGTCHYNPFKVPDGIDDLKDGNWGGVSLEDLIVGSIRTHDQNGGKQDAVMTDPTNAGSLSDLLEGDIRTPGYMTLPVCNYGFALDNWKQHGDKPDGVTGWPCATWPSPDKCQISSFEDATSEASPLRSDCETLIKNWEGTQKSWTVYTTGLKHKTLDTNGTCAFGAQARNTHGSVKFQVGAQDLVDLVSESMNRFQGGGGQDWRGGRGHLQGECQ